MKIERRKAEADRAVAAPAPAQALPETASSVSEQVQTSPEQRGSEQAPPLLHPFTHHFSRISVSPPLQAKLTVSQPDDPLEVEAEQVAEQVMGMSLPEMGQPSAGQEAGQERSTAGDRNQTEMIGAGR